MKNCYLLLIIVCMALTASAQDKIYKKGGEIIEAKVTEVGSDEIKYRVFNDQSGPMYTLDKDRIIKVVYQNGRIETYQSNLKDPKLYEDQAKSAIKVNFLAPLLGYTQLNFEHSLRPGRAYEVSLGLIGLGKRQELWNFSNSSTSSTPTYRNASGAYLSGGYKLSKLPDFVNKGAKYSHVLQGTYIKPELSFGIYDQNYVRSYQTNAPVVNRETIVFGGLLMNLGKQWVVGELLLIDIFGGVGYALDNRNRTRGNAEARYDNFVGNHFALTSGADSGFGINGGLKVGILINRKK